MCIRDRIYIVERTYEAEIRPEEQSEKAESCREILLDTVERAIKTEINRRTEEKEVGELGWFMSKT